MLGNDAQRSGSWCRGDSNRGNARGLKDLEHAVQSCGGGVPVGPHQRSQSGEFLARMIQHEFFGHHAAAISIAIVSGEAEAIVQGISKVETRMTGQAETLSG